MTYMLPYVYIVMASYYNNEYNDDLGDEVKAIFVSKDNADEYIKLMKEKDAFIENYDKKISDLGCYDDTFMHDDCTIKYFIKNATIADFYEKDENHVE